MLAPESLAAVPKKSTNSGSLYVEPFNRTFSTLLFQAMPIDNRIAIFLPRKDQFSRTSDPDQPLPNTSLQKTLESGRHRSFSTKNKYRTRRTTDEFILDDARTWIEHATNEGQLIGPHLFIPSPKIQRSPRRGHQKR